MTFFKRCLTILIKAIPAVFEALKSKPVHWEKTRDPSHPYRAMVEGREVKLRINADFPETDLYTPIIDGEEGESFSDFSPNWKRPS